MPRIATLLLCLALAGCALTPAGAPSPPPWRDDLFAASDAPTALGDPFALSPAMARHLREVVAPRLRTQGRQQALVDALLRDARLRLEYDGAVTRTAAEAFDARAGNCLSLVLMTAAFAKALGLPVEYGSAAGEAAWSRQGDLLLRTGHVNVTLGPRPIDGNATDTRAVTIDFLPPDEARRLRTRALDEATVVAMFMNNRAAEALLRGRLDEAYAWTRAALARQPDFLAARNTLGVLYLRRGAAADAQTVFRGVLAREPGHTRALANLAQALAADGRTAEAQAVRAALARVEGTPPFHHLALGQQALQRGAPAAARDWLLQEAARGTDTPELHHALAQAYFGLGDAARARDHLAQAAAGSTSAGERARYASKLAWLRGLRAQ